MSNPYGPPPSGGQPGPGSYGASGGPSWGAPQGGSPYGAPAGSPYGQVPGPQASGPQGGPGFGQGVQGVGQPNRGASGPGAPGQAGSAQWGGPPRRTTPSSPADLDKLLPLITLGLGALAFLCGFLPFSGYSSPGGPSISVTVFGGGPSYLPVLLLLAGFLAYAPALPGGRQYLLPTALLSLAGFLGAIGSISTGGLLNKIASTGGISDSSTTGIGIILLLVVALLQTATAGYAWFAGTGKARPRTAAAAPGAAFGWSSHAPASPAVPQAPAGFAGYEPGAFKPSPGAPPVQTPDAPAYSGYGGSQVPPTGQGSAGYHPNTPGQLESSPDTDATPAVSAHRPVDGAVAPTWGSPNQAGPDSGQYGRDDGPPADVTQQVRF